VSEDARLLATVALKNSVGATWRKTLATREWLRVPEAERAAARRAALQLLLSDASPVVAQHAGLLAANVARFDAPRRWPELLPTLLAAACGWHGGPPGAACAAAAAALGAQPQLPPSAVPPRLIALRALRALKHVLRALCGARASAGGAAAAQAEARATRAAALALLPLLASEWGGHAAAAAAGGEGSAERLELASRCAATLSPLLRILPSLHPETAPEFAPPSPAAAAAAALYGGTIVPLFERFLAALQEGGAACHHSPAAAKHTRLLAQCVAAAQDSHALDFVPFLPPFVHAFAMLVLRLPPDAVAESPKLAHALTHFLANVLLCPLYKPPRARDEEDDGPPDLIDEPHPFALPPPPPPRDEALAAAAAAGTAAVAPLLADDGFVRALIRLYLTPTNAELEEWRADPAALLAAGEPGAADAASAADEGSPRQCAETLLLCLLLRDKPGVSAAVLRLAAAAQAAAGAGDGADGDQAAIVRDGAYRALGVLAPELPQGALDLPSWLRTELLPRLRQHAAAADAARRGDAAAAAARAALPARLLAARALWLVGRFAGQIAAPRQPRVPRQPSTPGAPPPPPPPPPPHDEALAAECAAAALPHLSPEDPLLALHSSAALLSLTSACAAAAQQRLHRERYAAQAESRGRPEPGAAAAAEAAAAAAASAAVAPWGLPALSAALGLLPALVCAPESAVSVLRLVALLIDTLGRSALAPHAAAVAAALPPVWSAVDGAAARAAEPGASARLHCALLDALAHLVAVLGTDALGGAGGEGGVGNILYPLCRFATEPGVAGAEALLDDGVALWLAALRATAGGLSAPQAALSGRVFQLVEADPGVSPLLLLQGYILLGGAPWVVAHAQRMATALQPPLLSTEGGPPERALLAAATAADVGLQIAGETLLPLLAPALGAAAQRLALMLGGDGAGAREDAQAELIPTASAAKAYCALLARASLQAPAALRRLAGARAGEAAAVWAELAQLRSMEEMLHSGRRWAAASGRGAAPPRHSSLAVEERHVSAAALCLALAEAAAVPGAAAAAAAAPAGAALPPGEAGEAAALLRRAPAIVALALQALSDLVVLSGGGEAAAAAWRAPLPLDPCRVEGCAPDGQLLPPPAPGAPAPPLPNQVDLCAWRLSAQDPVRRAPLAQRLLEALRALRAAAGEAWLLAALGAEEKLAEGRLPAMRAQMLNTLLQEAAA